MAVRVDSCGVGDVVDLGARISDAHCETTGTINAMRAQRVAFGASVAGNKARLSECVVGLRGCAARARLEAMRRMCARLKCVMKALECELR